MTDFTSVDSISKVFIETEEFRDYPLRPLFTLCSVYAGEAIASDDLSDEKIVPVYGSNGIRAYTDKPNHLEDQVLVGRQGSVGTVHFAKAPFWAAEHALVVEPRTSEVSKQWLKYVLETLDLSRLSRAVAQPGINASSVSFQRVPTISLGQQKAIADHLDRETAEIDAAVADLDRYVELLEKRRRIIIVDGFNDPTYNPIVQRLKFLTVSEDHRRIPIKSGDRVAMAGEYPYYGASGIIDYVNDYLWDNEKRLLLSEDGANLVMRNHPVAFVADGQYWVNNHAHVLKCVGGTSPELVALAIEVTSIAHLITGSAQPKLTAAAMGEISFMFPHSAAKQDALLKKLKPELDEIDSLIAESTKLRDLLLKRRSVLITEVVTGRKQV